jgi:hypothetical protein
MITKPPWDAPRPVMEKWVNEQLDAKGLEFFKTTVCAEIAEDDEQGRLDDEISFAEIAGDIQPLRERLLELLPALAKTPAQARGLKYVAENFVHLPKRARGHRYQKLDDPVGAAVEDCKRIRALWQKHYGKRNRGNSLVSAETIAAKRRKITVDKIIERRKHPVKPVVWHGR